MPSISGSGVFFFVNKIFYKNRGYTYVFVFSLLFNMIRAYAQAHIRFEEIKIMAKNGFSMSDRKKIKALTASHTATKKDCGTVFIFNLAAGGITLTLPSVASAGEGWWCKVICGITVTGTADHVITENTSADTNVLVSNFVELETDTATDGPHNAGHTSIVFENGGTPKMTKGDFVRILCDGTNYYCEGVVKLDEVAVPTA
jgi:hypothetical protein